MKKLLSLCIAAAALLLAGCTTDPVTVAEVLQPGLNDHIYTKCNLWYLDPEDISCLNIQDGSFLPVGSEIVPVRTTRTWLTDNGSIEFTDTAGNTYKIDYRPAYRLQSMRDFIESVFTLEPPDKLFEGISPRALNQIRLGRVMPGMTRREVLLSYGAPPAVRTPDLRNETWYYWISPSRSVRVIFDGDTVRELFNVNE